MVLEACHVTLLLRWVCSDHVEELAGHHGHGRIDSASAHLLQLLIESINLALQFILQSVLIGKLFFPSRHHSAIPAFPEVGFETWKQSRFAKISEIIKSEGERRNEAIAITGSITFMQLYSQWKTAPRGNSSANQPSQPLVTARSRRPAPRPQPLDTCPNICEANF